MIRTWIIGALVCLSAPLLAAQSLAGDWEGTLSAGGSELHLVLHMGRASNGDLTASIDSVDQGSYGIPVSSIRFADSKLSLRVDAVNGTYEGVFNAAGTEIDGTWSQGMPLQLNFKRAPAGKAGASRL